MSNTFTWPEGVRCGVWLSVNFDAESFDLRETTESRLYGRFSYGRYGVRAGLPRMLELMNRQSIRGTFFISGSDALRHRDLVREIAQAGHEIGARGMELVPLPTLGESEFGQLQQCRDILGDILGMAPKGFRAFSNTLSYRTLSYLADLGFEYDASFQDDDFPYCIGVQSGKTLIEIPSVFALDDAPIYSARHTHARLLRIWTDEFDAQYAAGVMVPLTTHLRGDFGSTRAARISTLSQFIDHVKRHEGVAFMTGAELASCSQSLGLAVEEDPLLRHEDQLKITPYRGDLAVKSI
jgi:peptidoglycan/xylan/chitin deacetylase (PgdA/CDA1 family)